jgi:hypothetical protein
MLYQEKSGNTGPFLPRSAGKFVYLISELIITTSGLNHMPSTPRAFFFNICGQISFKRRNALKYNPSFLAGKTFFTKKIARIVFKRSSIRFHFFWGGGEEGNAHLFVGRVATSIQFA